MSLRCPSAQACSGAIRLFGSVWGREDQGGCGMDLYQLECFRVVASMQHISNAALVLHITQSALSKIINRVEDYAGTPLFDRVKGKIYLNESGEIFLRSLDTMFDALNSGLTEVRSSRPARQHQIYVASSADSLLFQMSEEFFATHPDINIKYSVMSAEQIHDGFLHGKLDFALTTYPLIEPGIEWKQIAEEELVMQVGENSPFAQRKSVSFAELRNTEMMCESLGGDLRTLVDRCCEKAGFRANVVLESDIGSAVGFRNGLRRAVSFMPAHRYMQIIQALAERSQLRPPIAVRLTDPVPIRITGIARKSGNVLSEQAQGMYDYVLEYFRSLHSKTQTFMQEFFETGP